jgi:nucleoside-triphosphatase THEP1
MIVASAIGALAACGLLSSSDRLAYASHGIRGRSAVMMDLSPNQHPLKLAAIVYRPADDIDGLLATFASDLICQGNRVGGIVQRNTEGTGGTRESMELIDLMTGAAIRICRPLGSGAGACKLDPAGLAEAATAVSRAVAANVDLVIVNKFSEQEAAGGGLRAEIADAVAAGRPLLTAVPDECYDAWANFTGSFGTTLLCQRRIVEDWWREMSLREKRARVSAHFARTSAAAAARTLPFRPRSFADRHVGRLDRG